MHTNYHQNELHATECNALEMANNSQPHASAAFPLSLFHSLSVGFYAQIINHIHNCTTVGFIIPQFQCNFKPTVQLLYNTQLSLHTVYVYSTVTTNVDIELALLIYNCHFFCSCLERPNFRAAFFRLDRKRMNALFKRFLRMEVKTITQ